MILVLVNYNNHGADSLLLSVHTCSSWASSGMTRNVLQPCRFLDFRMSPKMWSPMYRISFPFAPNKSQTISEEPEEKKKQKPNSIRQFRQELLNKYEKWHSFLSYHQNTLCHVARDQCMSQSSVSQWSTEQKNGWINHMKQSITGSYSSESSRAYRVHLSEHCALPKKHWLPGIHQNKVKVGLPGLMGCTCL